MCNHDYQPQMDEGLNPCGFPSKNPSKQAPDESKLPTAVEKSCSHPHTTGRTHVIHRHMQ